MSERKVLNKYYPADYDPSKIPKGKRNRNATFNIRIMAPFNMRCNMCKEYIYKGKKFNSRKEDVMDETYLGLRIFRFYIKCPRCVSEIAFKTDLENTDYTLEAGAKRLFEAEKIAQQMAEEERKAKEEDEMNPMKMLENRTKASRAEMDQIDSLEEIREMNTRKNLVNTDAMIEKYRKYEELLAQLQMEQEEEEIKEIFGEKGMKIVKRLDDSDDDEEPPKKKSLVTASTSAKPTDILAEDSKPSTTSKEPESWQKSVGSLSSKQKLKGLVVKKKSSLPAVATRTSAPADQKPNATNSNVTVSAVDTEIDTNVVPTESEKAENDSSNVVVEENFNEENHASKICQIDSPAIGVENGDIKTAKLADSGKSVSTATESSNVAGGSKLSALGMLGAYSDSESDSSG